MKNTNPHSSTIVTLTQGENELVHIIVDSLYAGCLHSFIAAKKINVTPITEGVSRTLRHYIDSNGLKQSDTFEMDSTFDVGSSIGDLEVIVGEWLQRNPGGR